MSKQDNTGGYDGSGCIPPALPPYLCGFAIAPVLFALLQRPGRYRSYCVYDENCDPEVRLEHDYMRLHLEDNDDPKVTLR